MDNAVLKEFGLNLELDLEQKESLIENGFLAFHQHPFVVKRLNLLREISDQLIESEGDYAGWEGKEQYYRKGKEFEAGVHRLGNLINKHQVFRDLLLLPEVIGSARAVVGNGKEIKIGGVDFREPKKGQGHQQAHIDWLPRYHHDDDFSGIIAMIFLDDSMVSNGATRVCPGSHTRLGWPDDHVAVENLPEDLFIHVEVNAGSIIVINFNLWHAGSSNVTGARRRVIDIDIRERKLPQLLNFKRFLSTTTLEQLSLVEKYVLGVRDEDPLQEEDSVGPGEYYRQNFGDKRLRTERSY